MARTVGTALALAAIVCVAAAPYSVRLDARRCMPLSPAEVERNGPDWVVLTPHVQRCPVPAPDGRVALTVDVFRFDRALATDFFQKHPRLEFPNPIIRSPAGVAVGTLPEGFPIEPPGKLEVRFVDWRGAVPQTIQLYEAGESALRPHPLPPLRWNGATRTYR